MFSPRLSILTLAFVWAASAVAAAPGDERGFAEAARLVPNLHVVAPGIWRGGQPDEAGLIALKKSGIRTIINLRNEPVLVASEKRLAERLGFNFVSIPLDVFNTPSESAVKRFLSLTGNRGKQPLFVHCLHGRDRTGAMVGIYRVGVDGWTAGAAYQEMVSLGFRPGFTRLAEAVFALAARGGRPEKPPAGAAIVEDLKARLARTGARR